MCEWSATSVSRAFTLGLILCTNEKQNLQLLYLVLDDGTEESEAEQNNEEYKQHSTHHSEVPLK